jgi:hypothetical protein
MIKSGSISILSEISFLKRLIKIRVAFIEVFDTAVVPALEKPTEVEVPDLVRCPVEQSATPSSEVWKSNDAENAL